MRTYRLIIFLLAFFSLSFMNGLFASPDSSATRVLYQINLRDGSKLVGSIVKQDSSTISFKTAANISIEIPRDQVESIRELAGSMVRGRYMNNFFTWHRKSGLLTCRISIWQAESCISPQPARMIAAEGLPTVSLLTVQPKRR
ncbi:hypothetical protein B1H10_08345 [candidate division KSB1 bacterium 4484_188]|nr:MAG: hypothetical protein B1H10_08345 [candidate division KSB1 bacterium 4484_188]